MLKALVNWIAKVTGCPASLDLQKGKKSKYKRRKEVEVARQYVRKSWNVKLLW